ncbi:MAG: PglZ domain-containing protein [Proteobacteria bacterium]|nr:PglZ domain-containing protein [Pseudomonadota bacterium]
MNLSEFISDTIFRPRLKQSGCLLVYDMHGRFREVCQSLASDKIGVVDASESSIESREAALELLRKVGKPQNSVDGMLIYVPTKKPETDEQKQADPFSIYAECGMVFPKDDGDEYLSLCLRAKPDHATQIRRVFAETPNGPSFSVIDAIGGGSSWPQLRARLNVESAREILSALLVPTDMQARALKEHEGWSKEAGDFLHATLAMTVKTRSKTWTALADELWRYVLFSEFVFDLPVPLPETLEGVPHAPLEARMIVDDVCDRLRIDHRVSSIYIERAETIEAELKLPSLCGSIQDLGKRDTFPFEERTFLRAAIKGISANDIEVVRQILSHRKNSIWMGKGESQAQWELMRAALCLVEACGDYERQLPDHSRSQADLLDFYLGSLREADRLQRELEQAAGDFIDHQGLLNPVIGQARNGYARLAEKVQSIFMKHVETAGWPPAGRLPNTDTFDRLVGNRLKESGYKVAFLMVDALRYELGVSLQKLLAEDGPVELQAAYAQLPSITSVGMAGLLPGANTDLALTMDNDVLAPQLSGSTVFNVNQRMELLRKRFGDRFTEMSLSDFARGKPKLSETTDLLVLRSTEIDSQLENNPETTLGLIPGTLKLIRVALHKLRGLGFGEAVIATDHGFFLNAQAEAGDVCVKPQGKWLVNAHDRMMLGNGTADGHSLVVSAEKLGIRGAFAQAACPRSMAPYRAGHLYFHGGLSLAEAVVPVLIAKLDVGSQPVAKALEITLTYKKGAKKITTRLPVFEVLFSGDLFSSGEGVEILLEAQDSKGHVIGEPRPGAEVNPATRTVTLMSRQRKQIALRMDPDFEGKFSVKALNPTTLAAFSQIKLETDYTV